MTTQKPTLVSADTPQLVMAKNIVTKYLRNDDERAEMYAKYKQLRPVFDFFNSDISNDYGLLNEVDLCLANGKQDIIVFEIFPHNDLSFVVGHRMKLTAKNYQGGVTMDVNAGDNKVVRMSTTDRLIFVRLRQLVTRDSIEAILQIYG